MDIDLVLDARAIIGEGILWSPVERVLYWIDIKKPALYRLDPATKAQRAWPLTSDVGAFALLGDGEGALVALRHGLFSLDFQTGALTELAPPSFDPQLFRFNEGACDAAGRFWVGVMFDPLGEAGPKQASALHSFTLEGGLIEQPDRAELHNGMGWSVDGRTFYLAHSEAQSIYAYAFDADAGRLGERKLFAEIPNALGLPDGAAVDSEGGYWCALHGGGKVRRYAPDGTVDRDVALPVSQPTMCAFGGEALDVLYITTASDKMTPDQREREPLAGAIFSIPSGVAGLPRPCIVR